MTDFANLQIRVGSGEVSQADRSLKNLAQSGAKAERATDGVTKSANLMRGAMVAGAAAVAGLYQVIKTQREFDRLNAGLETATGNSENAKVAFAAIQDLATQLPVDLVQVTDAFVKLTNYGLTPSEHAIISYTNTAAALGKDLSEMVEAVADAATGEFERLKEFGIRASKEGDRVKFTFRGVTKEVGFNAKEIENYLIGLGDVEFAGAATKRMDTLDGAISNLGDEWSKLLLNVSQSGLGDIIEGAVRGAISALEELNDMVASGELGGYLKAYGSLWSDWGKDVTDTLRITGDAVSDWGDEGSDVVKFFVDAFVQFPVNVRALVQSAAVELYVFLATIQAQAVEFVDDVKAVFTSSTIADASKKYEDRVKALNEAREESLAEIIAERDAALASYDNQIDKAKDLRKEYDKNKKAREDAAGGGDRLAQFGQKTPASTGPTTEQLAKAKAQKEEFEKLRESLLTEEQEIQESYNRRVEIIAKNTEYGSAKRLELMKKLGDQRDAAFKDIQDSQEQERQSLYNSLLSEEESLRVSYEERKKTILESTAVTEQERIDLMRRLNEQFTTEQAQIAQRRTQEQLSAAETLFGGLSDLAKEYGGEQSQAYKVLFSISKAFSIAQAIMSIQTGLAKAQELGFPANLAEMARVAATGAGIVASIRGSNFSGAYDKGGYIPSGKVGLVGEYGPELVRGPASVTSRRDTERMMSQPSTPPVVNVRNINVLDPNVVNDYLVSDEGERVIVNVMRRNQRVLNG